MWNAKTKFQLQDRKIYIQSVPSENLDQPVHLDSLTRIFIECIFDSVECS